MPGRPGSKESEFPDYSLFYIVDDTYCGTGIALLLYPLLQRLLVLTDLRLMSGFLAGLINSQGSVTHLPMPIIRLNSIGANRQ